MKTALIGGIGNVLLGDDGIGPYVVHLLEAQYSFKGDVDIEDLGTPGLDLTHRIVGRHAVILVDCVAADEPAGSLLLYRKEDILLDTPTQRLDPHSPALSECLMTAGMLGAMPENILLVGIAGNSFEPGDQPRSAVREAALQAIEVILSELRCLGFEFEKKETADQAGIWWSEAPITTLKG